MKIKHLRWYILALVFAATIINYLDRQTISVMAPAISKIYRLDEPTMAIIFSAFLWAYTIGPTITGWIIDKLGSRRGYILAMGIWSAAGVLTAAAPSIGRVFHKVLPLNVAPVVLGFIVCRFILGLGESANWPAAIKTISEWFPTKERSFAIGWFNSGSSVGAVVAPGLCTWLLLTYGWRMGFIVVGAIGFIWIAAWLVLYRPLATHPLVTEDERNYIRFGQEIERDSDEAPKVRWIDILRIKPTRGVVLTRFFMDPVWWFYTIWLPTALAKDRGMDLKSIAVFATLAFLASDLGNIFGGGASSWLIKNGWSVNRARKSVMVPCALCIMSGLAVPFVSAKAAVALIALIMFCYQSWSVNMLTIPADVLPRRIVASAAGLSHMGAGFGGIVMNYVVGHLAKSTGSFTIPFMLMGLMPLIGIAFLFLVIGRIAPYGKD
ncbi:MAG: MFS transporter [Armatimonadota bacterium]|nr:MFS transporter [Armatimonadota bacterium]